MQFDVAAVTKRADEALVRNLNNPEESRRIYTEELFDWSDYYTEQLSKTPDSEEARHALSCIVQLRIAYCTMEINLKQFKKATTIYDDSLKDPVVNRLADIYLAYVEYCTSRGKSTSAQNVFLKGLSAGLQQMEADKLWTKFLSFIQIQQQTPDLTVEQLYEDVRINAGVDALTPPGSIIMKLDDHNILSTSDGFVTLHEETKSIEGMSVIAVSNTLDSNPPFSSLSAHELSTRSHLSHHSMDKSDLSAVLEIDRSMVAAETKDGDDMITETTSSASSSSTTASRSSHNHKGGESVGGIGRISPALPMGDDLDSVTGMTPELLCRMYKTRPPMLFSAINREPTLRGISLLRSEEIGELETFLGEKLTSIQYSEKRGPADRYLDLIEALWTAQALKERHFDYWFTETKKIYDAEETGLRRKLNERENKIGLTGSALADIKSKNQIEWQKFSNRRAVQMEVLNAVVNKTIFTLLLEQQRALLAAGFPRFSIGIIERLENSINSCRSTVSSSNSSGASVFDTALVQEVANQRTYICALLSLRVNYKALRNASISTTGSSSSSHLGSSSSGSSSGRGSSIAGRRGGLDDRLDGDDDYYSTEAKLMRKAKRRRLSDSTGSGSESPYGGGPRFAGGSGVGGGGGFGGNMPPAMRGYGTSGGSGLSIPPPAAQKTGIVAAMEKDRLAAVRVQPPTGAATEELLQKLTSLSSVMQKLKK